MLTALAMSVPSCAVQSSVGSATAPAPIASLAMTTSPTSRAQFTPLRPNIVLVLCDDLGAFDLGCTGSNAVRTPHIDRLRARGVLFTSAYSSAPVCAPSRCALLTGRSTAHSQIRDNHEEANLADGTFGGQRGLAAGTPTLPRVLRDAGYATGCFGKWGLGGPSARGTTGHPLDQGFDSFVGILCQRNAHNHYAAYIDRDREQVMLEGNSRALSGAQFVPDLFVHAASEWMSARLAARAPFFLYYATPLPHLALQAPEGSVAAYAFDETPYTGGKGYLPCPRPRATFAAMVSKIDEAVGELVATVERHGALDNTVFIFTSDNGATWELGGFDPVFFQSNRGLRGSKASLWEGGIRVPLIVAWCGHTPEASTCAQPVVGYDLTPTVLDLAGVPRAALPCDGVSLASLVRSASERVAQSCAALADRPPMVWEFPGCGGQRAVRDGRWKFVQTDAREPDKSRDHLFDLEADAGETTNLARVHPDIVARLRLACETRTPSEDPAWNYP